MSTPNRPPAPSYQDVVGGQHLTRILTRELKYFLDIFLPTILYLSIFREKRRQFPESPQAEDRAMRAEEIARRAEERALRAERRAQVAEERAQVAEERVDHGPIQTTRDCIGWDRGPLPSSNNLGREITQI